MIGLMFAVLFGQAFWCGTTADQPRLSLTITNVTTFMCTMTEFREKFNWLHTLQIVKLNAHLNGEDAVLASVADLSGPMTSDFLQNLHPDHHATSQVTSKFDRSSWLQLTIINYSSSVEGMYACRINYREHPADGPHLTWNTSLAVNLTDQGVVQRQESEGFSVDPLRGVAFVCQCDLKEDNVSLISIVTEDSRMSASYSPADSPPYSTSGLVSPRFHVTPAAAALEAHMLDTRCDDDSRFLCTVKEVSGRTFQSLEHSQPRDGCPLDTDSDNTETSTVTLSATNPSVLSDSTTLMNKSGPSGGEIAGIVIGVVLVIIIVVLVVTVVVWRKKGSDVTVNNSKNNASLEKDMQSDKRSSSSKQMEDNYVNKSKDSEQFLEAREADRHLSQTDLDVSLNLHDLGISLI